MLSFFRRLIRLMSFSWFIEPLTIISRMPRLLHYLCGFYFAITGIFRSGVCTMSFIKKSEHSLSLAKNVTDNLLKNSRKIIIYDTVSIIHYFFAISFSNNECFSDIPFSAVGSRRCALLLVVHDNK